MNVRVCLGGFGRRIAQRRPDGHDHIEAGVDELLHVVGVVFGVLGFDVLDIVFAQAKLYRRLLYAFPSGLVEAAVVNATHVGDQTDLEGRRLRAAASRRQAQPALHNPPAPELRLAPSRGAVKCI